MSISILQVVVNAICGLIGAAVGYSVKAVGWTGIGTAIKKVFSAFGPMDLVDMVKSWAGVAALALLIAPHFQGCDWSLPTPGPAPVPSDSLKVAFFIETADTLTKEQHRAIYGKATRDYLNSKAKDWREYDKDDKVSEPFWKDVAARPRTETPWLFITNGKKTYEGKMPIDIVPFLKQYGG